jgi:hypothetical protein
MKNAIKRLIERFYPPREEVGAQWSGILCKSESICEHLPPLSREKESAMVKLFDARSAYLKDPSFENHLEVLKAHLSSKEADND